MASGRVDVLAFIGTSRVADTLKQQHPRPHRLRCVLGLDAKNPAILLPDADLELAVRECLLGSLSFNGQRCTALKILFVHASICEEFLGRFSQAVSGLKIGMPWEPEVKLTPLPEIDKPKHMDELVQDALGQGARVVNPNGGAMTRDLLLPGGGVPGQLVDAAVLRGAVRAGCAGGAVRRYRRADALRGRVELRAAGQPVRAGPGCDWRA